MEELLNLPINEKREATYMCNPGYSPSTSEWSNSISQGGNVMNTEFFQTESVQVSCNRNSRVIDQTIKPIHNDLSLRTILGDQMDDKEIDIDKIKVDSIGLISSEDLEKIMADQLESNFPIYSQEYSTEMSAPIENTVYADVAKESISLEVTDQDNPRIFDDNEEVAFGSSKVKVIDHAYKLKRESNTQAVWKHRAIDPNAEKFECKFCGGQYLGKNGLSRHQNKNPNCQLLFQKLESIQKPKPTRSKKIPVVCEGCGIKFLSINSHKTKSRCSNNSDSSL